MVLLFGSSNALAPAITDLARAQVNLVPTPKPFTASDDALASLDPNAAASSLLPSPPSFTPSFAPTSFGDINQAFLSPAQSIQAPGMHQPFMPIQTAAPAPTTTQGTNTSLGGDWAGVDQWNADIQSAASQTGVDPNDLKGIMKVESNGDPGAVGSPGVGGLMQVNSSVWGSGPWQTDNAANILKGAQIYKSYLDQYNGDKTMALRAYHGFGSDGNTTDTQYADMVQQNINQLNAGTTTGSGGAGTSTGMQGLFGQGANVQDWGAFNVPSSNGLYGYGTQYGLNGTNHTGVDVIVPYGTAYNAAFSGHVICAGTGNGTDESGGNCAAFQDLLGPGAGRVEVMSNDGNTVMIYGHSSASDLPVGATVTAGQALGVSGGENSPHVHVEVRVRDSSTPSGWRIVDPTPYLNGTGTGTSYANSQARTSLGMASSPIQAANNWLANR